MRVWAKAKCEFISGIYVKFDPIYIQMHLDDFKTWNFRYRRRWCENGVTRIIERHYTIHLISLLSLYGFHCECDGMCSWKVRLLPRFTVCFAFNQHIQLYNLTYTKNSALHIRSIRNSNSIRSKARISSHFLCRFTPLSYSFYPSNVSHSKKNQLLKTLSHSVRWFRMYGKS